MDKAKASEEIKKTRQKMLTSSVCSQIELCLSGADIELLDTAGFIEYLLGIGAVGRRNAKTARWICKELTGKETREKHVRTIAQKAMFDTAGGGFKYRVYTIGGIGIYLSEDENDSREWFYANWSAAITLLKKCRAYPVLVAEHKNEALNILNN